jgi:hypothetical protein
MAKLAQALQNSVQSTQNEPDIKVGAGKLTNQLIYGASIVSIVLSLATVRRNPSMANFFGLWAPTILGLGILMKENRLLESTKRLPAY